MLSQFSLECFVQDGRKQRVQFGGGLGSQARQRGQLLKQRLTAFLLLHIRHRQFVLKAALAWSVHGVVEDISVWACGRTNPARRELFGRYLLTSLRAGLLHNEAAIRELTAATNDPGVHEMVFRKPEAIQTAN